MSNFGEQKMKWLTFLCCPGKTFESWKQSLQEELSLNIQIRREQSWSFPEANGD